MPDAAPLTTPDAEAPASPATERTTRTMSEADSKRLLSAYGVAVAPERIVADPQAAIAAATAVGYPVVAKLVGERIAHKTERGLVRLGLADPAAVGRAATELLGAARPDDGDVAILIAPMIAGARELIVGLVRDPQFGPNLMLGIGGVLAEALGDVVFRPAPLDERTAHQMLDSLATQRLLGEFRGEPALDRTTIVSALVGIGRLAIERPDIASVDVNPMIIAGDGRAIAVDALVEYDVAAGPSGTDRSRPSPTAGPVADVAAVGDVRQRPSSAQFRALFEPRGVVVTGASTHPGKFGFVSLHNLLAAGYRGAVYATNLGGERVLGIDTVASIDELPDSAVDLALICTPAAANAEILAACARKGIGAAFVTSAGYGESGPEGRRAEAELVALADRLGILIAGPNGQGLVSTPADLCAQIVAPYPPAGRIGVASQSGNLVSSLLNMARASGVGISRAISAGNAAAVGVADYLGFYAEDPATSVGLAYLEGITDGRRLMAALGDAAARQPLVVLKGGATAIGARAAASHTGALAADDRLFDGACAAYGITRARSVDEAFELAATFATQPSPTGPNVVVLTTAGGWGVITADAVAGDPDLVLITLPDDLRAAIDEHLPPRWSRANPVDCAGGETRDTIPTVMELIARHPSVDAIVYLGLGIQSNQARMFREGRFHPGAGLDRIVEYHERQDRRFAEVAAALTAETGKPILCATELAVADPSNPGPAAVRASGRLAYASGDRAVRALGAAYRDARFRGVARR